MPPAGSSASGSDDEGPSPQLGELRGVLDALASNDDLMEGYIDRIADLTAKNRELSRRVAELEAAGTGTSAAATKAELSAREEAARVAALTERLAELQDELDAARGAAEAAEEELASRPPPPKMRNASVGCAIVKPSDVGAAVDEALEHSERRHEARMAELRESLDLAWTRTVASTEAERDKLRKRVIEVEAASAKAEALAAAEREKLLDEIEAQRKRLRERDDELQRLGTRLEAVDAEAAELRALQAENYASVERQRKAASEAREEEVNELKDQLLDVRAELEITQRRAERAERAAAKGGSAGGSADGGACASCEEHQAAIKELRSELFGTGEQLEMALQRAATLSTELSKAMQENGQLRRQLDEHGGASPQNRRAAQQAHGALSSRSNRDASTASLAHRPPSARITKPTAASAARSTGPSLLRSSAAGANRPGATTSSRHLGAPR